MILKYTEIKVKQFNFIIDIGHEKGRAHQATLF